MRLNQVTVPSCNVEASIKFYESLGLKLIVSALPHYARFLCPDGDSTFSIHYQENLPNGNGAIIYFEDDHLDQTVKALVYEGVKFQELPKDKPWLWREARLQDPDGNQLILFRAGKNRINPPWRI